MTEVTCESLAKSCTFFFTGHCTAHTAVVLHHIVAYMMISAISSAIRLKLSIVRNSDDKNSASDVNKA